MRIQNDMEFKRCKITFYPKTIGDAAFEECHIDNLKIPEGVESIGDLAFWNYFVPGYSAQTLILPSTLRKLKSGHSDQTLLLIL